MAWDKSKPVNNGDLLSPEIRANWDALDSALMAPLAAGPVRSLYVVSSGGVLVPAGWLADTSSHLLPGADNVRDIGSASARPRTHHAGTSYLLGLLAGGYLLFDWESADVARISSDKVIRITQPVTGLAGFTFNFGSVHSHYNWILGLENYPDTGTGMLCLSPPVVAPTGPSPNLALLYGVSLGAGSMAARFWDERGGIYTIGSDVAGQARLKLEPPSLSGSHIMLIAEEFATALATGADLAFIISGNYRWWMRPGGLFEPAGDDAQDIGTATSRVRDLWLSRQNIYKTLSSAPGTPTAGHVTTYAKSDKKMYQKDDAGLETILTANNPMTASGDMIYGGASGAPTRLPKSTDGMFLRQVAGIPAWFALPSDIVDLPLEAARFPDGTANNLFPMPNERISTGTPASGVPKLVELVYQFDATVQEFLIWKGRIPKLATGGVVLVVKWSMISATSGNIRISCGLGVALEASGDVRALVTPAPTVSADQAVPGTLGQQKELRLTLTGLTNIAEDRKFVCTVSLYAGSASSATGDRVLEAAWLEFAR